MGAPAATAPPDLETQADVYAWTGVIARSRLQMNIKVIAFTVTTFANGNGSRVFPGVSRLMVRTGFSRSTITRALAYLRAVGLLELVRRGNRRRGLADEYRLILAPDLLDRIDLPSLEEEAAEAERVSREHTEATRNRQRKQRFTVSDVTVNEGVEGVDNPPESASESDEPDEKSITFTVTQETARTRSYGQEDPSFTVRALTPHLRIEHLPRKTTHGSTLAGDPQNPASTKREPRSHQPGLMTIVRPDPIDCDHCGAALDPDGTCFVCRGRPMRSTVTAPELPACAECGMVLDPCGTCPRCPQWAAMQSTIDRVTQPPSTGATA